VLKICGLPRPRKPGCDVLDSALFCYSKFHHNSTSFVYLDSVVNARSKCRLMREFRPQNWGFFAPFSIFVPWTEPKTPEEPELHVLEARSSLIEMWVGLDLGHIVLCVGWVPKIGGSCPFTFFCPQKHWLLLRLVVVGGGTAFDFHVDKDYLYLVGSEDCDDYDGGGGGRWCYSV